MDIGVISAISIISLVVIGSLLGLLMDIVYKNDNANPMTMLDPFGPDLPPPSGACLPEEEYSSGTLLQTPEDTKVTSRPPKVFLGGTCNNSTWREVLIPMLKCDYFNPVVDDWTEECYQEELKQREECDYCLYVITPEMMGVYSIAEVIDDSNKRPEKTLFCIHEEEGNMFDIGPAKSLCKVGEMVENNGGKMFSNLQSVASYLNSITNVDVYYTYPPQQRELTINFEV